MIFLQRYFFFFEGDVFAAVWRDILGSERLA